MRPILSRGWTDGVYSVQYLLEYMSVAAVTHCGATTIGVGD